MKNNQRFYLTGFATLLIFSIILVFQVHAEKNDLMGWEIESEYQQLYDVDAVEKLKVYVKDIIEIKPLPGMAKGIGLVVEDDEEGELYTVHICPVGYKSKRSIGIKKRDKLTLRGCFVEIGDDEVIMASKIKFRGKTLKVRLTSDGKPFWAMSEEELKKELSETE